MCQKLNDFFENKSVLILGFGREGVSSYNYLRKYFPDKDIAISDMREVSLTDDSHVIIHSGEDYLEHIFDYDVVLKTPGIPLVNVKIPENVKVTCQMDLFLKFADCKKVGITGTKGKTTTSTLTYELISAAGKDAFLVGNIGVPVFDIIDECSGKIAVIEMSCHQLEFCEASPDVAIFTNIYQEHLDHYDGFEGYVNAKLNIVKYQTEDDVLIYNADQDTTGIIDFSQYKCKKIPVSAEPENDFLRSLISLNDRLLGSHSHQDIFFAEAAARLFGANDEDIVRGVKNFKGIPHRMEPVGVFGGIEFYNDSIATIPHAVECAVEALGNIDTLIFGGLDRGIDYGGFIDYLAVCPIGNIIGMPETGTKICAALAERSCGKNIMPVDTMDEAVELAFKYTKKGCSCLLSPAAPSYNAYKNFEEKGDHFKKLVKNH
ncbi:MAG: UDP-N-acetylmuramoyl-L-alanine--D-glutamate ligase [Clostridia bacterium]|nr:UDP-N-acetylmuramoyl-L-alanine--D-glutamate ligase [Clostridia bacterium]